METDNVLDKMLRVCDELIELSHAQGIAIRGDDAGYLRLLIEQRGRMLSTLDLSVFDRNAEAPGGDAERDVSVQAKKSVVMAKLREMLCIDEENKRALQARLMMLKNQLSAMGRGRHALKQYAYLTPRREARYIDRRR